MRKVRWGVLSTAKIGADTVIPAMQQGAYVEIVALASRNQVSAQLMADRLRIPQAYGSYEDLLADADIDAVYIPLPNHLHVPWSLKALEAGKHVLCEKPIAMTAAEAQALADAARRYRGLKVMEAFMYRFHPQWRQARQMVTAGDIGVLRSIQTIFSYYLDDATNIRNMIATGGGALMDIGCYAISLSRFLFGSEPRRVWGTVEHDPRLHIDRLVSGVLDFDVGAATFTCGTQLSPHQRVSILGDKGRIEIEIPFNAPADRPCRMWREVGPHLQEILVEPCNQYTLQGDAFSLSILDDTDVPTPLDDAVANMSVIEAFRRSSKSGSWAKLD
jgi:predicted dehydrogenase